MKVLLTFPELAYGQHAVAGREVPYAQCFVITDGGTEGEVGVSGGAVGSWGGVVGSGVDVGYDTTA